ncbi:MAG: rod shape-determining protein MreD [Xanthomonadaceae bacterium]|nr:rod shape-determining protein MreD [Xanthomonadaceae bacterium]
MSSKQLFLLLLYLITGLFLSVLQSSVFPRLGFSNISPDLHYVLIISLPVVFPVWLGTIVAIILGIITDTFLLSTTGLHTIGFLCLYYILVYLQQTVYFDHLLFKAFMAGLGHYTMFLLLQVFFVKHIAQSAHFHLASGMVAALATSILAIPLLYVLQTFNEEISIHKRLTSSTRS